MPKAILIILDGWGINHNAGISAIEKADTPFVDSLNEIYPHATLITYGEDVGLPEGQMGNSEVGHLNIGAGRIIYQDLTRINKAIRENQIAENQVLKNTLHETNGSLHFIGLISDGGVHSHILHLIALIRESRHNFNGDIYVHAFTDGRDVDPKSGFDYLNYLQHHITPFRAKLVSVIGRYYAMDRDNRWERTKLAYDLLVHGNGVSTDDILKTLEQNYSEGITDEFINPMFLHQDGTKAGTIRNGDTVIFFNFRSDRPRQLTAVLTKEARPEFGMFPLDIKMVTMTPYDDEFKNIQTLFDAVDISDTLGSYISSLNKTQLRVAETEKYPHVSYFFSGGREMPFNGEERILVPSPKVPTYDLMPEMSAQGVTDATIAYINVHHPDFICLNFANTDMVGHTGVFQAAVKATETVDQCLLKLIPTALEAGYKILIIADHGNSDVMINPDGSPNTAHTKNPVPVIYVADDASQYHINDGILADIAPTILFAMEIPVPPYMTGKVLISKKHKTN